MRSERERSYNHVSHRSRPTPDLLKLTIAEKDGKITYRNREVSIVDTSGTCIFYLESPS